MVAPSWPFLAKGGNVINVLIEHVGKVDSCGTLMLSQITDSVN
jgi:hypothetical protein